MTTFLTLRNTSGLRWKVVPSKFDRQVGDAMFIENEKWVVVTTGDRGLCIAVMNKSVERLSDRIKGGYTIAPVQGVVREANILK